MENFRRNQEGYPDPTAATAIARASKRSYRPLVYICSRYSGDIEANTEAAKGHSRFAVDQGAIPFAPHLLLPLYMKEDSERELAMFMDMIFLGKCDEVWVFGKEYSEGMMAELDRAKKLGKRIKYFDEFREEA